MSLFIVYSMIQPDFEIFITLYIFSLSAMTLQILETILQGIAQT